MNTSDFQEGADGRYEIRGQLTFQTVPQYYVRSVKMFQEGRGPVTVDLAGVTLADSAGIALLVEWQEQARTAQRSLRFANIPEQVQKIIHVSGLQHAFAID